jgi:hypothetical protein
MKRILKMVSWLLLVAVILIQFIPVNRKNPAVDLNQDYLKLSGAPTEVATILRAACYDCHSNESKYPWYAYVAPVSFIVQNHINEGRSKLNFSEWGSTSPHDLAEATEELPETIAEGEMPLQDYLWMHPEARLNAAQKRTLIDWFNGNEKVSNGNKTGQAHDEEHDED